MAEKETDIEDVLADTGEVFELKTENFWVWITSSEQSESGHSINLDKRIPGFASVLAVILFFLKEFVHYKSDEGSLFTDLNFTISLQILNIVVLLTILIRGLKISTIDTNIINTWFKNVRFDYIELLETKFIKYIKSFFGMTAILYFVLILNSLLLNGVNDSIQNKHDWLNNIRSGRSEINKNLTLIRPQLANSKIPYSPILMNQLDVVNESMKQIIYNDSITVPEKSEIISHLHRIRNANELIGEALLNVDDYFYKNRNYFGRDSLSISNEMKKMYHGNHIIEVNAKATEKDGIEIIIIHILKLIFSNIGALFLVYSFLVLYTKNTTDEQADRESSLLSFKYLLTVNHGTQSKKITRVLTVLFILFFVFTISQIVLELCFQENSEDISTLFSVFSGIFNALALSLLVARFESSTFDSTFSVLVILYLYANIQVLFGVFDLPLFKYPHLIEDITLLIAFIGKCFLYLYVLWILRTDRLKYYFYNRYFNNFSIKENLDWKEFIQHLSPPFVPRSVPSETLRLKSYLLMRKYFR